MTRADMEALGMEAVQTLSNYEGEEMIGYDGSQDDFLEFEGLNSFATEVDQGRVFQFVVSNTSATPGTVFLNKGFKQWGQNGMKGLLTEGAFQSDDSVPANMIGAGMTSPIDEFRAFAYFNPVRVVGMKLTTTEQQVNSMVLYFGELSPFKDLGEKPIYPSVYVNEQTWKDNMVTLPVQFDYNNQNLIRTRILGNTSVTFTMVIGGIMNTSAALSKKAARAVRNNTGAKIAVLTRPQKLFGSARPALAITGRTGNT